MRQHLIVFQPTNSDGTLNGKATCFVLTNCSSFAEAEKYAHEGRNGEILSITKMV